MAERDGGLNPRNLLVRFLINAAALFVADALVPGISITGWPAYAVMAVTLGLVNALARPVLTLITCPLIVVTLGLFLLIVNTAMLGLSALIAGALGANVVITGFWSAFFGALIISIVSWLIAMALD
ncbi:MAG: phage holin family protein [Dehalococcoidia bacterium]